MRLAPWLLLACLSTGAAHAEQAPQPPEEPSTESSTPTVTRPPWRPRQGIPDLTSLVARRAPLALQSTVLLGLDFAVPVALAVPGAIVGAAVGAVLGTFQVPFSTPNGPRSSALNPTTTLMLGAVIGGFIGGTLTMLGADIALSTFHLQKLAASRIMGTLVMGLGVVLAAGMALATVLPLFGLPTPVTAVVGAFAAWACCMGACFIPPLALVAGAGFRMTTDYVNGSALWEEAP